MDTGLGLGEGAGREPGWHPAGPAVPTQREKAAGRIGRLVTHDPRRYDVIEADAILPQGLQSGMLYSEEFLTQVRARLAPGGLYVQWAPTPRTVETFVAVFPHVVMLQPISIMLGSAEPIAFDRGALLVRLAEPQVAARLTLGRPGCCDWAAMMREPPWRWTPDLPRGKAPLTDLFPRDEFYLNSAVR